MKLTIEDGVVIEILYDPSDEEVKETTFMERVKQLWKG